MFKRHMTWLPVVAKNFPTGRSDGGPERSWSYRRVESAHAAISENHKHFQTDAESEVATNHNH